MSSTPSFFLQHNMPIVPTVGVGKERCTLLLVDPRQAALVVTLATSRTTIYIYIYIYIYILALCERTLGPVNVDGTQLRGDLMNSGLAQRRSMVWMGTVTENRRKE